MGADRFRTRAQVVVDMLRRDILWGSFEPGRTLSQEEIASRYGTSHIPVREALRLLAGEGLVVLRPHREAIVRRHSAVEIAEMCWIRQLVEPQAARLAAERVTSPLLQSLEATVARMERLGPMPEVSQWLALNRTFHLNLYRAAGKDHLLRLITDLFDQTVRYIRAYLKSADQFEQAHAEHLEMIRRLVAGDADGLESLTRRHIEGMLLILTEAQAAEATVMAKRGEHHGAARAAL